jgi:hypothetical protein
LRDVVLLKFGCVCRIEVLILLEAAIGIEPMNQGFAESKRLFAQVSVDAATCGFIAVFSISRVLMFTQIRDCFAL